MEGFDSTKGGFNGTILPEGSGGGGGGTTNYNDLDNKPKIDGTELSGNKTPAQLGLQTIIADLADIRRGAGAGETALQEVPDTYRTSSQQDEIDNAIKTRLTTIEGKESGWDAKADTDKVLTKEAQTLTQAEKDKVLENIGAIGEAATLMTINGTEVKKGDAVTTAETAIVVDGAMSDSSTNAVQNKVVKAYVDRADKALQDQIGRAAGDYINLNYLLSRGYIRPSDGTEQISENNQKTDYVDISLFNKIKFLGIKAKSSQSATGYAFYDENKEWISSVVGTWIVDTTLPSSIAYEYVINVPNGAKYFRTSTLDGLTTTGFYLQAVESITSVISDIGKKIDDEIKIDFNSHQAFNAFVSSEGFLQSSSTNKSVIISVEGLRYVNLIPNDTDTVISYAKTKPIIGEQIDFVEGLEGRQVYNKPYKIKIPEGCNYIVVLKNVNATDRLPSYLGVLAKEPLFDDYIFETRFQVNIETNQPQNGDFDENDIDSHAISKKYSDNCVLYLPESYSRYGSPTKLIIFCKQGGTKIGTSASEDYNRSIRSQSPILNLPVFPYLINKGYAVLAADGEPDEWLEDIGLGGGDTVADLRVCGNYVAVASTRNAYDYVIDRYNIDRNGVFVFGYSQGGHYAQNVADLSGIPILAVTEVSPVCSFKYHQWDFVANATIEGITTSHAARLNIARMFGMTPFTTSQQLEAMQFDDEKNHVIGYDPWTRNMINPFSQFTKNSSQLWMFSNGVTINDVDSIKINAKPTKIFMSAYDDTLSVDVAKAFIKSIKNGGGVADIVLYEQTSSPHRFFDSQTTVGSVTVNQKSYNYGALAVDVAIWMSSFGGY